MMTRRIVLLICVLCLSTGTALAASGATFLYLLIPPSPQANGMAGVYTAAGNDDPFAPLAMPSVIGLMGEHTKAQAAFYPSRMDRVPKWSLSHVTFGARTIFVGFNRAWVKRFFRWDAPVSIGLGYYEIDADLGESEYTDSQGNSLGTFHSRENAKALGLGLGWQARRWQGGFGFLHKFCDSDLGAHFNGTELRDTEATAFATDLGVIFRVPLADWFKPSRCELENHDRLTPFFTPELGYSLLNLGGEVAYFDRAQADPLPRIGKLHCGASIGIDVNTCRLPRALNLFVFNWGRSTEDELVERGPFGEVEYTDLFADIRPLSDLAGNANANATLRTGWEFGCFETFYYREGRIEDAPDRFNLDSKGVGYRTSGLFTVLATTAFAKKHSLVSYLLNHIDIQYQQSTRFNIVPDYGYYRPVQESPKDEQISLFFRY